jgi:hypothetical protein
MAHRGTRSEDAIRRRSQRRAAKKYMLDNSFEDHLNGDVVNLLRWETVVAYVGSQFEGVDVSAIPCAAEPGCVLSDPYGRGAFQR